MVEILIPDFRRFRKNPYKGRLITFDPGETTGWSIWDDAKLSLSGQLETSDIRNNVAPLEKWLDNRIQNQSRDQIRVVMEEYRIYGWKTDSHAWSTVHTIKLIGQLETLCTQKGIGYQFQGAGLAKTFATDEKLQAWGFYRRGQRHARDAIRHALYYYCTPEKAP